jgi:hypothetical protein
MAPGHQHPDQISGDLPLGKEHLEYLVPEDLFEILPHDDGSHLRDHLSAGWSGRSVLSLRIVSGVGVRRIS